MSRLVILRDWRHGYFAGHAFRGLWALLFCFSMAASAQNSADAAKLEAPFSIRATHLLGFENTKDNSNGSLSIKDGLLNFKQEEKPTSKIQIGSIQSISLNEEDKQIGGVPMTLGKAAAPFGGGRVVSLFAHKDYDVLTLEYVDSEGGLHGSIFELNKGRGELVRQRLMAEGALHGPDKDQRAKTSTVEGHK